MVKTNAAQRAIRQLKPTQMGCGTKAGAEATNLNAQAHYEANRAVAGEDGVNAFGEAIRQAVLTANKAELPEATKYINTTYGFKAPIIVVYTDNNVDRKVPVPQDKSGGRGRSFANSVEDVNLTLGGVFLPVVHVNIDDAEGGAMPLRGKLDSKRVALGRGG